MPHTLSVLFATVETLVRLALWFFLLVTPLLWLDNHFKARRVLAEVQPEWKAPDRTRRKEL